MSPTLQLVAVGVLVAGAALYVLRATWKTWTGRSAKSCGAGCGKCSAPAAEPTREGRFPLRQL